MSFWSCLSKNANTTVTLYDISNTIDTATGKATRSRTLSGTVQAIEWETTWSNFQIAEKLRDRTDKVLAVAPDTTISSTQEAEIDSLKYSIINIDNVASKDKVIIVYLQGMQ